MKYLFFILSSFWILNPSSFAEATENLSVQTVDESIQGNYKLGDERKISEKFQNEIVGQWLYIGFNYRGEFHAPLDDNLELIFAFSEDGVSDLSWHYKNEFGKCHRRGEYKLIDGILEDKIIWVDPENMNSCGVDPDMQMGRISRTPIYIEGDRMIMYLDLSGESLTYILERIKKD